MNVLKISTSVDMGPKLSRNLDGNQIEEEKFATINLLASQANTVIPEFTFAHADFSVFKMTYTVKEAVSGDIKSGELWVVTNGTDISAPDLGPETNDTGITFDAVVNGANVEIQYSSGANAAVLQADVKRIKA